MPRRPGTVREVQEPPDPAARELTAEVAAVRWRSPDGDFAVLIGITDEGDEVVLTGAVGHVHELETVQAAGAWRRHPRHGWRFEIERVRVAEPASEGALLAYLSSVKHIGQRGARFLLERHGPADVLAVVDADPARVLREIPGIGALRIGAAVRSWNEQTALREVRLFLESHGVPAAVAARIYRAFGAGSIARLQADPYAMTELDGIGFATADALADALGVPPDAPARLDAGLLHVLREAEQDGHCHLPRAELAERARRLLRADAEDRVDELAAQGRLVVEEELVFDAGMHRLERGLAAKVAELAGAAPALRLRDVRRPTAGAFVPNDAQWSAISAVLEHRLSILTGGPGTGKTSAMRALVDLLRERRRSVRLCAPTGKAARRLAETTGADATTIHRLLEWVPGEGFARGPDNPIDGADVLVVDEASMLSVRLAASLLSAVGPRTHVLLVGDVDQLAPVGPGRVLEDLIDSGAVVTTRLAEIFRQAARSLIVRAAHAVNHGEPPPTRPGPDDIRDFFVIDRRDPAATFAEICSLVAQRLPAHYGLQPVGEVQVLAPMHRGPAGIDAFNAELRSRLNPDGAPIPGTSFRLHDRVIQTVNNHERELMNGELGLLVHHDADRDTVIFAADDGRLIVLPIAELDSLRLAYAISVHKAQGSSAPAVVFPLVSAHSIMLTRNLVYTAVTRAERVAVLVGEPSALALALRRRDARRRHTRLAELVSRFPSGVPRPM
jgi:exodeoxyribonuclease V alpha subunit